MTSYNITTITDEAIDARLSSPAVSDVGVLRYHAANGSALHFMGLKRNGALARIADPGTRMMGGKGLRDVERDGSVNGFEIITEPCTLQAACYGLPWDELCKFLDKTGCRAHDGYQTGIHVHISRAALGMTEDAQDMAVAKILVLMDKFERQLTKFARRDWANEYYCKKNGFLARGETSTKKMVKKFKDTEKRQGNRYRALNLTNAATIEFRIFKSTLNPLSIRAIYQLCFTLAEYAKTHTTPEIQEATWSDLVGSCKLPELKQYCEARGIA